MPSLSAPVPSCSGDSWLPGELSSSAVDALRLRLCWLLGLVCAMCDVGAGRYPPPVLGLVEDTGTGATLAEWARLGIAPILQSDMFDVSL